MFLFGKFSSKIFTHRNPYGQKFSRKISTKIIYK